MRRVLVPVFTALVALLMVLSAPGAAAQPPLPASTWPLSGSPQVLNGFKPPSTPYGRGHRGVDLAAHVGDRVLAAAAGRVTFAGLIAGRGVVVVDHGGIRTTYEPVSALVAAGSQVQLGQVIGALTSGGHCGGTPCLHWGLLRGTTYLDPLSLGGVQQPAGPGEVRLLPAAAREVAVRRAAERAAAARAALATPGLSSSNLRGPSGRHRFLHPVPGGITSGFGRRFHPVLHVWKLHDGTDFGASCGTAIRAPYAGVVTRSFTSPAYGHRLFLNHGRVGGRHVVTSYNHAERYVAGVGSRVSRGQVIGYVGATGYATGCHLHLMVWLDGGLTDPMIWL